MKKIKSFVSHIRNVFPIVFGNHVFEGEGDDIHHFIDGKLVATIPREGWEHYSVEYPEIKDVISDLTIQTKVADNLKRSVPLLNESERSRR